MTNPATRSALLHSCCWLPPVASQEPATFQSEKLEDPSIGLFSVTLVRVLDGQEMPRLLGVSILSFKEAKGTFLTPVRGNINFFLWESFFVVQMKLCVKFQRPRLSLSYSSHWCLHSFL